MKATQEAAPPKAPPPENKKYTNAAGFERGEDKEKFFRMVGKLNYNSARNEKMIKQKNITNLETNIIQFTCKMSFMKKFIENEELKGLIENLTVRPHDFDEQNTRQIANYEGAIKKNLEICAPLAALKTIFNSRSEMSTELAMYVNAPMHNNNACKSREYFHAETAVTAFALIENVAYIQWLEFFRGHRVVKQRNPENTSFTLIFDDLHPEYTKVRYLLLSISKWYNSSNLVNSLREKEGKRTPGTENESTKSSCYEYLTIKNHTPMTSLAREEKQHFQDQLNVARSYLEQNGYIKKENVYHDKDLLKLYEEETGNQYIPFTENFSDMED